jgi:hypothetical protein
MHFGKAEHENIFWLWSLIITGLRDFHQPPFLLQSTVEIRQITFFALGYMDEISALPSCIQPRKTRNLSTPFWKSNQNPLGRPKATMLSFTQPISNQKKKEMEPRQEKKKRKEKQRQREMATPLYTSNQSPLPMVGPRATSLQATGFVPQLLKTTKKLELILTACSYFS